MFDYPILFTKQGFLVFLGSQDRQPFGSNLPSYQWISSDCALQGTVLAVRTGKGECYWHVVARGWGCCLTSCNAHTPHRIIQPKTSICQDWENLLYTWGNQNKAGNRNSRCDCWLTDGKLGGSRMECEKARGEVQEWCALLTYDLLHRRKWAWTIKKLSCTGHLGIGEPSGEHWAMHTWGSGFGKGEECCIFSRAPPRQSTCDKEAHLSLRGRNRDFWYVNAKIHKNNL